MDVNVKDCEDRTPLMCLVSRFIREHQDPSIEIPHRVNPFGFEFSIPESRKKFEFLCIHHGVFGVDFNEQLNFGAPASNKTIFEWFCYKSDQIFVNYVKLILEHDTKRQIIFPRTPFSRAQMSFSTQIDELLQEYSILYK